LLLNIILIKHLCMTYACRQAVRAARIMPCIKYLIYRIFNNNLQCNITAIVLVWYSNLTKEI